MHKSLSRTWLEVDLDELKHNYRTVKAELPSGVNAIAVVKGNAYGLGAVAVCRTLLGEGADMFAVAELNEALIIREALDSARILVMGYTHPSRFDEAYGANITLTVSSLNQVPTRGTVHVKIDTGMHRLGFDPDTAVREIFSLNNLDIEGIYTHLALHDAASDHKQIAMLNRIVNELSDAGLHIPMVHALDSIGAVRYPGYHMSAIRVGASLFGNPPRDAFLPLRPVARFKTRVAQTRWLRPGEYLGYDHSEPLLRTTRVATLCAGYADGYPRYNNKGSVLIHGARANVLGLVCMDQMMVDVTDIQSVVEGDEVVLLGDDITITEYSETAGFNRNETLARIGLRVPRIYISEGSYLL